MKKPKKPTFYPKRFLKNNGYDPDRYLIIKDTPDQMEIIARKDIGKEKPVTLSDTKKGVAV